MNIYLADEQKNVAISSQFPAPEDIPLDYFEYLLKEDGTRNQDFGVSSILPVRRYPL